MRYLCLGYHDERAWSSLPDHERQQLMADTLAYERVLRGGGHVVDTKGLQPASSAATLRFGGGRVTVTDGPFAETREQLAGYFLVDAANSEEALAIAAKIPGARLGFVEVRPVREVEGLPRESLLSSNPRP